MRRATRFLRSIAAATALLAGAAGGGAAHAATFKVTTTADGGTGSLREAIVAANGSPGPDSILFRIPGSGVQTIEVLNPLPPVTEQVTIDGSSQGKPTEHLVVIDGRRLSNSAGLELEGKSSWLHHLVLHGFEQAIVLAGAGKHLVSDCRLGTDADGRVEMSNHFGIGIVSSNNTIVANLISASAIAGIAMISDGNVIDGNLIGSDRDGLPFAATGSASQRAGIEILSGSHNRVQHNTIGGWFVGIMIGAEYQFTVSDNYIVGNSIGISSNGGPLGDLHFGVLVTAWHGQARTINNVIGGIRPGEGNRIAHVGWALGPFQSAILIADDIFGFGVHGGTAGNSVRGNLVFDLAPGAMPIDLGFDTPGPDPNDWGDMDAGENNLQNAPVIVDAWQLPPPFVSALIVRGELYTPLRSSITYAIDVYATTAASSPGVCEARRYLGSGSVSAGYNGIATFSLLLDATLDPGAMVTATATVDTPGRPADTSELSPCVTVH
jgi:Periplasmic copper-binding protein (NosD)